MEKLRTTGGLDDVRVLVQTAIKDREQYKKVLEAQGDEAQQLLDAMQVLTETPDTQPKLRSAILKMMLDLSRTSELCPNCLHIRNVKKIGNYPVGCGAFGDVWKGEIDTQPVCLKVVRATQDSDMKQLHKDYMKEAIVWQQLRHPNLLPFIGIYYLDEPREQLCLVSPWMNRGNLTRYLKDTRREDVDHQALAHDVASGLAYLHERRIVHGDLKGLNVLVTADERASIGDFGLSRVADTHSLHLFASATGQTKGTTRWLSPELLRPTTPCPTSTSSDLYAYACVCYEIFVGRVPFYELPEVAVIVAVLIDKKYPTRPTELTELTDAMWKIMLSCWDHDIHLRPTAQEVLSLIGSVSNQRTGSFVRSHTTPEWDTTPQAQIWKNVQYPSIDTTAVTSFLTVRARASTEQVRGHHF
ncbi:Rho guanine nucleotide exchange factor [Marasmius tenuissimus]|nr:Rho guanine nucleotide exchange factor [Marasmius tenuissimus]